MNPYRVLVIGVLFAVVAMFAERASGAEPPRPNILWITCEDMSPNLGCCGDAYAVTPRIDRFARQGVRYTRAFATASVCTPARSSLITGVFASSLSTQHLRGPAPLPPKIRPFSEYLREAGYYCTNNVKEDYNFAAPRAWDESSRQAGAAADRSDAQGKDAGHPCRVRALGAGARGGAIAAIGAGVIAKPQAARRPDRAGRGNRCRLSSAAWAIRRRSLGNTRGTCRKAGRRPCGRRARPA